MLLDSLLAIAIVIVSVPLVAAATSPCKAFDPTTQLSYNLALACASEDYSYDLPNGDRFYLQPCCNSLTCHKAPVPYGPHPSTPLCMVENGEFISCGSISNFNWTFTSTGPVVSYTNGDGGRETQVHLNCTTGKSVLSSISEDSVRSL